MSKLSAYRIVAKNEDFDGTHYTTLEDLYGIY